MRYQEPLPCAQPVEPETPLASMSLPWDGPWWLVSFAVYSHLPTFLRRQPRSREAGCCWEQDPGQLPALLQGRCQMQRPWLQPGDAGPRLPYALSRASIRRAGLPSRIFGTWGIGGRAEGRATEGGGRGGRASASGIGPVGPPLDSWLWVDQGSRWGE